MRLRRWLCAALLVAACSSSRSRLDRAPEQADDPWGGKADKRGAPDRKGGDGLGDLQRILSTIAESMERPGPYEAPEQGKDGGVDEPHWGVLELGGGVVERQAYALSGGGGIELGKLIERLRAFAKQDKLSGLLLRVEALGI